MRVESSSFVDAVLTAQLSTSLDVTSFVLTQSGEKLTAFLVHSSYQLFIKSPEAELSKSSLLTLLELAEELGVQEVFVCIPSASENCDLLVSEFVSLDFELLSPRSQPTTEFVVLRFDF